jgi:hypothetical protein
VDRLRLVTHHQVDRQAIEEAGHILRDAAEMSLRHTPAGDATD